MSDADEYVDHDLPMLRVHRAWEAAEEIADEEGISRSVALRIARRTVAILGKDTRRWGRLCVDCRSLIEEQDGRSVCPEHGPLGAFTPGSLLIAFDPLPERVS